MSGDVASGRLNLTILGDVPGVVHLQLDKASWSFRPGSQVRFAMLFAGYPGVSITGIRGGGSSVLSNLTAENLPAWMHGFTAAQSAAIAFPDSAEPSWNFGLHGTTAAVNALQQCVLQARIAGVPPPFKSVALQPVVSASDHCLSYDPATATVTGTVRMAVGYGPPGFGESPNDPKFNYAQLVPDRPVCVTDGGANNFGDVKDVKAMELFLPDHARIFNARPWIGKHVAVIGTIDQAMSASQAATDTFLDVRSLRPLP